MTTTSQDLLFVENFGLATWKKYFFPAGTTIEQVANEINYPPSKVKTAIRNRRSKFAEYDISWV